MGLMDKVNNIVLTTTSIGLLKATYAANIFSTGFILPEK